MWSQLLRGASARPTAVLHRTRFAMQPIVVRQQRRLVATGAVAAGGANGSIVSTLRARGLVADVTNESGFLSHVSSGSRAVYAGFDPTADSLHVGNLLVLTALRHFQAAGHQPICLIGGATGLIGDPSGRSTERPLMDADRLRHNLIGITQNIKRFLTVRSDDAGSGGGSGSGSGGGSGGGSTASNAAVVVNNMDWYRGMNVLDFLRDTGRHFRMSSMLARDSVKSRLTPPPAAGAGAVATGLSFTEFTYQTLQAYDFAHLNRSPPRDALSPVTIQIGGADQWGNITAGIDLIHRLQQHRTGADTETETDTAASSSAATAAFGLTVPLLTTASGVKFGKSVTGSGAVSTIWLSAERTSPYAFYQYFVQTPDADVHRLLRLFTFIPLTELSELERSHAAEPHRHTAQRVLAESVTRLVHGEAGLADAQRPLRALFASKQSSAAATAAATAGSAGGDAAASNAAAATAGGGGLIGLSWSELNDVLSAGIPQLERSREQLIGATAGAGGGGMTIVDLAVGVGACASKTAARTQLAAGGLYLNGERVSSDRLLVAADLLHDRVVLLRSGKKKQFAVRIV